MPPRKRRRSSLQGKTSTSWSHTGTPCSPIQLNSGIVIHRPTSSCSDLFHNVPDQPSVDVRADDGQWFEGRLMEMDQVGNVRVHFKGFGSDTDVWISFRERYERVARLRKHTSRDIRGTYFNTKSQRYQDIHSPARRVTRRKRNLKHNSKNNNNNNDDDDHDHDHYDKLPEYCSICFQSDVDQTCDGPCMRSFHESCMVKFNFTFAAGSRCLDCTRCIHACALCGEYGKDFSKSKGVFPCGGDSCGRFYHENCRRKIAKMRFCPREYCRICCAKDSNLVKCIRCPFAFHLNCLKGQVFYTRVSDLFILCSECKSTDSATTNLTDSNFKMKKKLRSFSLSNQVGQEDKSPPNPKRVSSPCEENGNLKELNKRLFGPMEEDSVAVSKPETRGKTRSFCRDIAMRPQQEEDENCGDISNRCFTSKHSSHGPSHPLIEQSEQFESSLCWHHICVDEDQGEFVDEALAFVCIEDEKTKDQFLLSKSSLS